MNPIVVVLVALLVVALLPTWPYSAGWGYGYYPSGGLGLVLLILVIVLLMRKG
jgi:uncharacterized protein DUF3309